MLTCFGHLLWSHTRSVLPLSVCTLCAQNCVILILFVCHVFTSRTLLKLVELVVKEIRDHAFALSPEEGSWSQHHFHPESTRKVPVNSEILDLLVIPGFVFLCLLGVGENVDRT